MARTKKLNDEQIAFLENRAGRGWGMRSIAPHLNISHTTISENPIYRAAYYRGLATWKDIVSEAQQANIESDKPSGSLLVRLGEVYLDQKPMSAVQRAEWDVLLSTVNRFVKVSISMEDLVSAYEEEYEKFVNAEAKPST